jgi:hypothetical protein
MLCPTCSQAVSHQQQLIAGALVQEAAHTRQLILSKPLCSLQVQNTARAWLKWQVLKAIVG